MLDVKLNRFADLENLRERARVACEETERLVRQVWEIRKWIRRAECPNRDDERMDALRPGSQRACGR